MSKKRTKRKQRNGSSFVVILLVLLIGGVIIYTTIATKNANLSNQTKNTNNIKDSTDVTDKKENSTTTNQKNDTEDNNQQSSSDSTKENEYTYENQAGEEVKVEANKVVEATGFAGASNYKFYLKGTTLYFKNISNPENEEELLAYNVEDLYLENKEVTAKLASNGKIVKENNYITYKN